MNQKLRDQLKFGNNKLEHVTEYQPVVMQGYICNMCRVVNKTQYKTTESYQMKFDM